MESNKQKTGRLPMPTIEEADRVGICKDCMSYKPDNPLPSGRKCWSMRKKAIEFFGYCTRSGAAEMIAEREAKKKAPEGASVSTTA
jgi:hypothetical protein